MSESERAKFLRVPDSAQAVLIAAARDEAPVRGLTHGFYKYPARFSPLFARAAIETFTEPGNLVFDPHVGGGTTAVEARAMGREALGVDISELAEFVSNVKCTVFSEAELDRLEAWATVLPDAVDIHRPAARFEQYAQLGYYKHLSHPNRWRLRKAIEQGLSWAISLGAPRLERFGRCVVLRTAQWALDGRSKLTSVAEFRTALGKFAGEMVQGARDFRAAVSANGRYPVTILNRSTAGIEDDFRLQEMQAPRLVVTSPPYPGVHVLYHRWQVDGRKETPLPFMIANRLDGSGGSFYTMGDRKYPGLETYFAGVQATMSSVAKLADRDTVIMQMLAFSEAEWQLPRYLEAMEDAGLREVSLPKLKGEADGRLWRSVPGRRWYSDQRGSTPGSKEVVLFHVLKEAPVRRCVPVVTSRPRPSA